MSRLVEPELLTGAHALQASKERFRRYFDLGLIGMAITSPTKGCVEVNDELCRILGYNREELLAMAWTDMTHPDDLAADLANFDRVVADEIDGYSMDKRWIGKGGRIIHSIMSAKCVRREDRSIDYFIGLVQDITARKHAEEAARNASERIEMILDSITDAFFAFDDEWRYTYFNKHAEQQLRTLGKDPATLIGKVAWEEFAADPMVEDTFRRAKAERKVTTFEHYYPPLSEWVENRIYPGPDGGIAVFQRYVTERKRAEEALRKAQTELAHINRVTTVGELTVSIAHEINQPLAAIVANSEACRRWLEPDVSDWDEARQAARRVTEDAFRASDVIQRMRALAKKSAPKHEPLDVNDLIRETITFTANELEDNHVILQLRLQGDLPPVIGDRVQLQQVLLNLLVNSSEAMSAVDRTRTLVIRSRDSQPGELTITVEDSGVGLPQDAERIFESFSSTKPGGLGLGLSISRTIAEAHGGRLWATPGADNGATFHLALPATR